MILDNRPKVLSNIIKVLTIWILIFTLINLFFALFIIPQANLPESLHTTFGVVGLIIGSIVSLAIHYLILYGLWRGKNWVRILYLVLCIIGIVLFVISLFGIIAAHNIHGHGMVYEQMHHKPLFLILLDLVGWVFYIALLVILFSSSVKQWFHQMKAETIRNMLNENKDDTVKNDDDHQRHI